MICGIANDDRFKKTLKTTSLSRLALIADFQPHISATGTDHLSYPSAGPSTLSNPFLLFLPSISLARDASGQHLPVLSLDYLTDVRFDTESTPSTTRGTLTSVALWQRDNDVRYE